MGAGQRAGPHWGERQGLPEVRAPRQGARLPDRGGQEEPGQDERPRQQAAGQDQDLQEGDRGARQACRGSDQALNPKPPTMLTTSRSPSLYRFFQKSWTWRAPPQLIFL